MLPLVIFSGGTAFNETAARLGKATTRKVSYVLPVSDDGGSTAEIVRVIGGPAVGDIRSRCLRLSAEATREEQAVKELLGHRLPADDEARAEAEWYRILRGTHPLWAGVSEPYKKIIRRFLTHFETLALRAPRVFRLRNGSVGNFFFAGARDFFGSIESAILMWAKVSNSPGHQYVLPAIADLEERVALAARLRDGSVVHGQSSISHPGEPAQVERGEVDKRPCAPLPSPIAEVFYTSRSARSHPRVNPRVLRHLERAGALVYGMGSLFTSIAPSLVLRGVGECVRSRRCPKVLLLNGSQDRETQGMTASDCVRAVAEALARGPVAREEVSGFVTLCAFPRGTQVPVDGEALRQLGLPPPVALDSTEAEDGGCVYDADALAAFLATVGAGEGPLARI